MEDLRRVMPHIKDSDMEELAEQVLGKLQNMRKCWNWQTGQTKDLVVIAIVWVQDRKSVV